MSILCDHKSVGIIVWQNSKLLLIERKKPPFGFAPPAGHIDNHGSFEQAAEEELFEETGLRAVKLYFLTGGPKNNPCRRLEGTWHHWKIYEANVTGELKPSKEETKQARFYSKEEILALTKRTEQQFAGQVSGEDWEKSPGIEPVWHDWFRELTII